jgi:hypothetical protein
MDLKRKVQKILSRCIVIIGVSIIAVNQVTVFGIDSDQIDLIDELSGIQPSGDFSIHQLLIPRIKSRFITKFYLDTLVSMPDATGNILGYLIPNVIAN